MYMCCANLSVRKKFLCYLRSMHILHMCVRVPPTYIRILRVYESLKESKYVYTLEVFIILSWVILNLGKYPEASPSVIIVIVLFIEYSWFTRFALILYFIMRYIQTAQRISYRYIYVYIIYLCMR